MLKLKVIIVSTRPGRAGVPIAQWFYELAQKDKNFETELIDLAELNLPLLDEPEHPKFQKYQKDHTKFWSAKVQESDAFVFVSPEYNFGSPPSLLNALDYLYKEWNYKPAGFVSYGGLSGGLRSTQMSKIVLTTLKMMPMYEQVSVQFFTKFIKDGVFHPEEVHVQSADMLLKELFKWGTALKTMR